LPNQGGRVISIVDDDVSLRRSLRNLLRSEGLRIAEDSALSLQGGDAAFELLTLRHLAHLPRRRADQRIGRSTRHGASPSGFRAL